MYLSIFLGLFVSIVLFYFVSQRKIIVLNGGVIENIRKKNIKKDGKCYTIKPKKISCEL